MAPAPLNAAIAGGAPPRDAPEGPNLLDSPQKEITRDSIPVRTRPFIGSSSPIRHQSSRPGDGNGRQPPSDNRFAPLAADGEGADAAPNAEALIAEAQDQLNTRASILRAYTQAITKCAKQFSSGYGKHFAQQLRTSLL